MKKNITTAVKANKLYEASLKKKRAFKILINIWTIFLLIIFAYLIFFEQLSKQLFAYLGLSGMLAYVGLSLVFAIKALLAVEVLGYSYHRFFQHVSLASRLSAFFRRNQRFHWIHHMIFYPIGKTYKRDHTYEDPEKGLPISWALPAILVVGLMFGFNGFHIGTIVFVVVVYLYAKFVELVHERFHVTGNPWENKKYFNWLEDIHVLHHWDQRTNNTIAFPLMDTLFLTYMNPKKHKEEIKIAQGNYDLTVSDVINWRYLLIEATPAEYAAFISAAREFPDSLHKTDKLLDMLRYRIKTHPKDAEPKDLYGRAFNCLKEVDNAMSKKILTRYGV